MPTVETGKVFYRASDLRVIGTESDRKEVVRQMRVKGEGFNEGVVYDVPESDFEAVVERSKGEPKGSKLDPKDDPGRTEVQIANAVVRGDALSDPVDAEIAEGLRENAHAIVHEQDAGATGDGQPDEKTRRESAGSVPEDKSEASRKAGK